MRIIVNGRNIHLTDAIKAYVDEKFQRLDTHYDFIHEIHVFLSVEKNPSISNNQLAEATVHVHGAVVRVEESSDSLYASIDKLLDKVDRSLNKHKTKLLHRAKSGRSVGGESIRKVGFDEALEESEAVRVAEEELEGVYYTYTEGDEAIPAP
ncbi:MAG: ribosome-associated translation inhibitor RaiA [Cyanobacteria bacterium]|jgi:putative sigma-54 modulation protein|nr:ribosome-associated translation inhibitor RaiA [Cyanobacteriota bacterium]